MVVLRFVVDVGAVFAETRSVATPLMGIAEAVDASDA
jgi:hypothetical protein